MRIPTIFFYWPTNFSTFISDGNLLKNIFDVLIMGEIDSPTVTPVDNDVSPISIVKFSNIKSLAKILALKFENLTS